MCKYDEFSCFNYSQCFNYYYFYFYFKYYTHSLNTLYYYMIDCYEYVDIRDYFNLSYLILLLLILIF